MQMRRLRLPGLAAALLAAACTSDMNVTVTRTEAADEVLAGGPHCAPERIASLATAQERRCVELGTAFVGDTGRSWRCSAERVERDLSSVACSLGADAMVVSPVPDSACNEARADFFLCAESEG